MIDCADEIRSRLTMGDVLSRYGLAHRPTGRIPCPLHHGTDKNFTYDNKHYKCFVCNRHGGVIDFTMEYFDIPFRDALHRLNQDFGLCLPIGSTASHDEERELQRKSEERRKAREMRQNERKRLQWEYDLAVAEYARMDQIIHRAALEDGDLTDEYIYAIKHIDAASAKIDEAADALRAFDCA